MRHTHLFFAIAAMLSMTACVSLSSSHPSDPPQNTTVVVPQHNSTGCPAGVDTPC